jgi:hypothetical protein
MKHEDLPVLSEFYITVVMVTQYLQLLRTVQLGASNMEVSEFLELHSLMCVMTS